MTKGELGYEAPEWSIQQIRRASGLIEDICNCGVGHPNRAFLDTVKDAKRREVLSVHGCCGCCFQGSPTKTEKKTYEPNICISCKQQVESEEYWPHGAVIFDADGNYGSTIFDPIPPGDKYLRILVCDDCLVANADAVRHVRVRRTQEETVEKFDA